MTERSVDPKLTFGDLVWSGGIALVWMPISLKLLHRFKIFYVNTSFLSVAGYFTYHEVLSANIV